MKSQLFKNRTTGEIVTQVPLMDINNYEKVEEFAITNRKDAETYIKCFTDITEGTMWVENTLDLSKEWTITLN